MQDLPEAEATELQVEQPRDAHKVNRLMMLGLFIGNLRKERGLTATALAQLAGVHPSVITRIEQGYTTSLHERNQIAIADALGIDPEVLHHLENVPVTPIPSGVLAQVRQAIPQNVVPEMPLSPIHGWDYIKHQSSDEYVKQQAAILQKYLITGTPELTVI